RTVPSKWQCNSALGIACRKSASVKGVCVTRTGYQLTPGPKASKDYRVPTPLRGVRFGLPAAAGPAPKDCVVVPLGNVPVMPSPEVPLIPPDNPAPAGAVGLRPLASDVPLPVAPGTGRLSWPARLQPAKASDSNATSTKAGACMSLRRRGAARGAGGGSHAGAAARGAAAARARTAHGGAGAAGRIAAAGRAGRRAAAAGASHRTAAGAAAAWRGSAAAGGGRVGRRLGHGGGRAR